MWAAWSWCLSLRNTTQGDGFMGKKYEFKPDKAPSALAAWLHLSRKQRKSVLRWALYGVMLLLLSVLQDVILCRFRLFGATTELVPVAIFLICILEGLQRGCVFALISACLYLFSGSAAGTYSIVFITVLAVTVTALRQAYLQKGFSAAMLCTAAAMLVYELAVFAIGVFLGLTTWGRIGGFGLTAVLSLLTAPLMYPVALAIGRIGGDPWKE